jgi:mitochondrial fission protein ELM1
MQVNTSSEQKITVWVVTEGMAGTENQCLGVAQALGVSPVVKRITLRQPWKSLSPYLGFECAGTVQPRLEGPWPDVVLASGRKSIAAARYIKKASKGQSLIVQIQDPRINPRHFDLVAVPAHDPTRGNNVIVTDGAPNRITPETLDTAKAAFAPLFAALPGPRIAVLIGGSSKAHTMTPKIAAKLGRQLAGLCSENNVSLMITASRRTGEETMQALQRELAGLDNVFIWDGQGDNPYQGMLAWADHIVVTADSVSMLSDAGTTGKPVYMVPLMGGSKRFDRFHAGLRDKGVLRPFTGRLEQWTYTPLNAAGQIAAEIRKALGQRKK